VRGHPEEHSANASKQSPRPPALLTYGGGRSQRRPRGRASFVQVGARGPDRCNHSMTMTAVRGAWVGVPRASQPSPSSRRSSTGRPGWCSRWAPETPGLPGAEPDQPVGQPAGGLERADQVVSPRMAPHGPQHHRSACRPASIAGTATGGSGIVTCGWAVQTGAVVPRKDQRSRHVRIRERSAVLRRTVGYEPVCCAMTRSPLAATQANVEDDVDQSRSYWSAR
jgi:hypothetical protein